ALITDYEHLPEFMPNLEKVEVLSHDKDGAQVNYYLALPFGVKKRYRLQLVYDTTPPDFRMAWHSIPWQGVPEGEVVKKTVGYWQLTATASNETLLHYYTKTDPGHVPFGLSWLVDYLTTETVTELLNNTKQRLEKQEGIQSN
ncbi:MAG: SRPBCC family protein, partial [Ghiorsea sp.]|nr:SRPBCC family protein [Ghiorsea sp.]